MVLSTKLAIVVLGGLVFVAASIPAWAGSSTSAQAGVAPTADQSLVTVLSPLFANVAAHPVQETCKPDSLYSQHSVVGDSDACFVNHTDVRGSTSGLGFGGIL
jgi:hypothetical protein